MVEKGFPRIGGQTMAKKRKDPQLRLKRALGGGLFRYTFAVSAFLHFGIWGIIGWPRDGEMPPPPPVDDDARGVDVLPYQKLPPPRSIEEPEPPQASGGLETKGGVGEIPIPYPDALAKFETVTDAVDTGAGKGIGRGTRIIIDENIRVEEEVAPPPWTKVNVDIEYSEAPVLVHKVRPKYPDIARDSRVEGDVTLLVYVDESGNVRNAVVQASPGLPALDEAAKEAAMKCKFKPAKQLGIPVGVWYALVMEFRLSH
jgi:TonB family protein